MAGAEAWAGFTQEELRRLQRGTECEQPRHPHPANKNWKQLQREKALQQQCQKLGLQGGAASVPPEQLLSVPKHKPCNPQQPTPAPHCPSADQRQNDSRDQQKEPMPAGPCNGSDSAQNLTPKMSTKVEKKKVELQEKSRWEILQQEQRLIEEKNKRKKALLAKAIAERRVRLQVRKGLLRRILEQLIALNQGRKRYDKAESEYVAAKLDLQHKTEIKEHLTEHLCTIIQQNELRKARKLEELMQQLEVEADEENLELEIEVERMLQQQEAEAGRQASQSHSRAGTAKENSTPTPTKESEHANCTVASPSLSEQLVLSENSSTKSLSNMDNQIRAVNVTPGDSPACSDT
uniref:RAB6-interacting golgin n=1 Tax=Pavo cristatus TaxID=9049 RepID=A0A8C9G4K6_PAVCR